MALRSLATWCRSVHVVDADDDGAPDDADAGAGGSGARLLVYLQAALAPSLAPLVSSPPATQIIQSSQLQTDHH